MNNERRYIRIWKLLYLIGHGYIERKFKFNHDKASPGRACLVVSNHVTNWDPMLVALSFPDANLHFVASEHLFRMGWISKLICFLVAPIARRKGSSGLDTAMNSLRTLKAGGSVCLFAEGECSWDGCSANIVSSTGTLARASGAPLAPLTPTINLFSILASDQTGFQSGNQRLGSTSRNFARAKRAFWAKGTVQSKMVLQETPRSGMEALYSGPALGSSGWQRTPGRNTVSRLP